MELEKVYEPYRFEPHWAQWWIDARLYQVDLKTADLKRVFSIVIPPPNVTGSLHICHMLDHTIIDVAVRWHRMRGETTLWVPGTDHAGIATQMVVERQLAEQGLNRRQLGREEFERRVWQWKEEYGGRINEQIRREGASVDWSRERFTMDPGLSRAVRETFVRLWEKGLIYRGAYMVNWCPRCQTAISDVETTHKPVDGHLWHIRYPIGAGQEFLTVATTRPETMLGDTALAVHPDDTRYRHLIGKTAILPLLHREIRIIADQAVDPNFGTGVVKVTPAHDPNDFEIAKRQNLPFIKVIGEDARMTEAAGPWPGCLGHACIFADHFDEGQILPLGDFKVVWIMSGRDFYDARAKIGIDGLIGDDTNFAVEQRQDGRFANEVAITGVVGMYGQRRIAQHSFWPRRGYG